MLFKYLYFKKKLKYHMVNGISTRSNRQASFAYALTFYSDHFQFIKWKCTIKTDRLYFSKWNSAAFSFQANGTMRSIRINFEINELKIHQNTACIQYWEPWTCSWFYLWWFFCFDNSGFGALVHTERQFQSHKFSNGEKLVVKWFIETGSISTQSGSFYACTQLDD